MANADSTAKTLRSPKDAILRPLARVATDASPAPVREGASAQRAARSAPGAVARLGSGIFRFVTTPLLRVDEYAGIERLDRAELDETDGESAQRAARSTPDRG